VDARPALEADDGTVRRGNHGDLPAVRGNAEVMEEALLIDHFVGPPRLQVELPDLRNLADAVAVVDPFELLAQLAPLRVGAFRFDRVEQRPSVLGQVEPLDAALNAGDGERVAAFDPDAPDLGLAVVGRPLLPLALAVAGKIERASVRAPLHAAVVGP